MKAGSDVRVIIDVVGLAETGSVEIGMFVASDEGWGIADSWSCVRGYGWRAVGGRDGS